MRGKTETKAEFIYFYWNINSINVGQKKGRPKMRRGVKKASKMARYHGGRFLRWGEEVGGRREKE